MLEYIFHISDIHIKPDSYANLRHSFARLVADIEKYIAAGRRVVLVVAGDIFENKTLINTDDIHVFYEFVDQLEASKIRTIIIPGNHDYNVNSVFTSDNIQILTRKLHYVSCVSQTTAIMIDDVSFGVFSPIDKAIPPLNPAASRNVAILHEPVNMATYDNGDIIAGARFDCKDFAAWDVVLLGDIHLPQFLSSNIAYSGSFVQKNRGEGLDHGYILWDVAARTGQHVFIPVLEVYLRLQAHNDSCELPTLAPEQTVRFITLQHVNCTDVYIGELVKEVIGKYNCGVNKIINRSEAETKAVTDTIREPHIDITKVLSTMLKSKGFEVEIYDRIMDFHNKTLQNRKHKIATAYQLNYLVWSNVMCYGPNNYIDFRSLKQKLVVIDGKNRMGKSSILDILVRVLFNQAYRGLMSDMVNKDAATGSIKASIQVGQDEYVIEQHIYRKMNKTEHRVYRNGENVTRDTITSTYAYLADEVGLGQFENFVNITAALQQRSYLVDMSRDNLMKLFIKILDIDTLAEIEPLVKKKIAEAKTELTVIESELKEQYGALARAEITDPGKVSLEFDTVCSQLNSVEDRLINAREVESHIVAQLREVGRAALPPNVPCISELDRILKDPLAEPAEAEPTADAINNLFAREGQFTVKLQTLKPPPPGVTPRKLNNEEYAELKEKFTRLSGTTRRPAKNITADMLLRKAELEEWTKVPHKTVAELYRQLDRSAPDCRHEDAPVIEQLPEEAAAELAEFMRAPPRAPCLSQLSCSYEELQARVPAKLFELALSDQIDPALIIQSETQSEHYKPPDDLDQLPLYEQALQTGVIWCDTERQAKVAELISLQARLNNYTTNYGGLRFDQSCLCCTHNSSKLQETHNALSLEKDIAALTEAIRNNDQLGHAQQRVQILHDFLRRSDIGLRRIIEEAAAGDSDLAKWIDGKSLAEVVDCIRAIRQHRASQVYERFQMLRKCQENIAWHKNSLIQRQIDNIDQENAKIDANVALYNEICNWENYQELQEINAQIDSYRAYIRQTTEAELQKIRDELEHYKSLRTAWEQKRRYDELLALREALHTIQQLEGDLTMAQNTTKTLEDERRSLLTEHLRLSGQMKICKICEESIDRLDTRKQTLEFERKWLSEYYACIEHRKGIPAMILKSTAATLERKINDILSRIAEFKVHIRMDDKSQFHIYTVDGATEIPANMGSGYQKFLLDIIMRIVFTGVSVLSNPETLFIDEGFGCLDAENFSEISKILVKLKENFTMFVITHLSELKSYADMSLSVVRDSITRLSQVQHRGSLTSAELTFVTLADMTKTLTPTREYKAQVRTTETMNALLAAPEAMHGDVVASADILVEDRGKSFYCRGCKKELKNTRGAIERHLVSKRAMGQHVAYINQTESS